MAYSVRFVVVLCLLATVAAADDWPQFLGPNRNGTSDEKNLIDKLPPDGPEELWRTKCVGGLSGLAVVGDMVVTMTQNDGKQSVAAFDAKTGKRIWRTPVAGAYQNQMGNGPRATPTIVGDRVFAFTGDGVLASLLLKSGDLVWKKEIVKAVGGKPAEYGNASSPLVVDDIVVVTAGVPGATLVACDVKSGDVKWKSGNDRAGYSSATMGTLFGQKQIVAFTGTEVCGYEPKSGERLWSYPFQTDYDCNTATPVIMGDDVLISSGENHGSVLLKPKKDDVEVVWKSLGRGSSLRAEWQTPVRVGDYIFGMDNVGSAGQVTNLVCIDAKTGRTKWNERRFGKGNFVVAEGKLWVTTMRGELELVKASPVKFEKLGFAKYLGMTRQAPAIANGRLFFRDEKEMVCVKISK